MDDRKGSLSPFVFHPSFLSVLIQIRHGVSFKIRHPARESTSWESSREAAWESASHSSSGSGPSKLGRELVDDRLDLGVVLVLGKVGRIGRHVLESCSDFRILTKNKQKQHESVSLSITIHKKDRTWKAAKTSGSFRREPISGIPAPPPPIPPIPPIPPMPPIPANGFPPAGLDCCCWRAFSCSCWARRMRSCFSRRSFSSRSRSYLRR